VAVTPCSPVAVRQNRVIDSQTKYDRSHFQKVCSTVSPCPWPHGHEVVPKTVSTPVGGVRRALAACVRAEGVESVIHGVRLRV
jgi:hypothetical protein